MTIPAMMLVAALGFSGKVSADSISSTLGLDAQAGDNHAEVHLDANASTSTPQAGTMKMPPRPMPARPASGVFGKVTAVSDNTITVDVPAHGKDAAKTVTVDASAAVIDKNKVLSSVSGIAVGDTIMVEGTLNGTTVAATRIHDGVMVKGQPSTPPKDKTNQDGVIFPEGNGQPIIGGTVSAVNGNTITITNKSNVSYTVDASGAKISKMGVSSATASNIAVGDSILVQGTFTGTSVAAVNIVDATAASSNAHAGFLGAIGNFFARLFGGKK